MTAQLRELITSGGHTTAGTRPCTKRSLGVDGVFPGVVEMVQNFFGREPSKTCESGE